MTEPARRADLVLVEQLPKCDRHTIDLNPGWVQIMFIPKGRYAVQVCGDDGWHVFRHDAPGSDDG